MERSDEEIDELLTTAQVAAIINVDEATLKGWRMQGRGPDWVKLGDARNSPVRYRRSAVVDYISGLTKGSPE